MPEFVPGISCPFKSLLEVSLQSCLCSCHTDGRYRHSSTQATVRRTIYQAGPPAFVCTPGLIWQYVWSSARICSLKPLHVLQLSDTRRPCAFYLSHAIISCCSICDLFREHAVPMLICDPFMFSLLLTMMMLNQPFALIKLSCACIKKQFVFLIERLVFRYLG